MPPAEKRSALSCLAKNKHFCVMPPIFKGTTTGAVNLCCIADWAKLKTVTDPWY